MEVGAPEQRGAARLPPRRCCQVAEAIIRDAMKVQTYVTRTAVPYATDLLVAVADLVGVDVIAGRALRRSRSPRDPHVHVEVVPMHRTAVGQRRGGGGARLRAVDLVYYGTFQLSAVLARLAARGRDGRVAGEVEAWPPATTSLTNHGTPGAAGVPQAAGPSAVAGQRPVALSGGVTGRDGFPAKNSSPGRA
jgi:hypothetical protein